MYIPINRFKEFVQSYGNQNSGLFMKGQINNSMRQKRYFRNRPTLLVKKYFLQRCQGNSLQKGQSFQQIFLEQMGICMKSGEMNSHSYFTPSTKTNSKY